MLDGSLRRAALHPPDLCRAHRCAGTPVAPHDAAGRACPSSRACAGRQAWSESGQAGGSAGHPRHAATPATPARHAGLPDTARRRDRRLVLEAQPSLRHAYHHVTRVPSARTVERLMTAGPDALSRSLTITVAALKAGVPALVEAREVSFASAPACLEMSCEIGLGSVGLVPFQTYRPSASTTQIAVVFCDMSKPTESGVEPSNGPHHRAERPIATHR